MAAPNLVAFRFHHTHPWKCSKCGATGTLCCLNEQETALEVVTRIRIQHGRQSRWCHFDPDSVKVKKVISQ